MNKYCENYSVLKIKQNKYRISAHTHSKVGVRENKNIILPFALLSLLKHIKTLIF